MSGEQYMLTWASSYIDQQDSKGLSCENDFETTDFFPLAGSLENIQ